MCHKKYRNVSILEKVSNVWTHVVCMCGGNSLRVNVPHKVPFVGTLNLCLKMPDTEQKTRTQSDHPGLRKCQKTAEKYQFLISCKIWQFLDVFSSHDDWINFSSFALCQASQDTSLEYFGELFFYL